MLRRFAGGVRFSDMSTEFDRSEQELSAIFNTTVMMVSGKIEAIKRLDHPIMTQENLR